MDTNQSDKKSDAEKKKEAEKEAEERTGVARNLASASTALHGLLRKIGAGLDDLFPSSGHSRLKMLLTTLKSEGEDYKQIECLTELCELLSIGTEESMSSFSVDSFVPVLVNLLNAEHNPDIMLLASRALTHLMEALPSSCAAIVHYSAVPAFCTKLLTIEYIDLAEQSLQALEKISHDHPNSVLRAGGLMAVLSYLDFFATGVQRVAVSTAANLCRQVPYECFDMVVDSIPNLTNLLQYQDQKVVESACLCFARLCDSFADSDDKLQAIASHGLIDHLLRLVSTSTAPAGISAVTYTTIVRLLATLCHGSPELTKTLLEKGITNVLRTNLGGEAASLSSSSVSSSPSPLSRSTEQLYEMLTLANELLPLLPKADADTFGLPSADSSAQRLAARRRHRLSRSSAEHFGGDVDSEGRSTDATIRAREALFTNHPELLSAYAEGLLPVFLNVYASTVHSAVRAKCLSAVAKILHLAPAPILQNLLKNISISSFIAGLLNSSDMPTVLAALYMADTLMSKLPSIFSYHFRREGVIHEVDKLIASLSAPPTSTSLPASPAASSSSLDISTTTTTGPPPTAATSPPTSSRPLSGYSLRSIPSRKPTTPTTTTTDTPTPTTDSTATEMHPPATTSGACSSATSTTAPASSSASTLASASASAAAAASSSSLSRRAAALLSQSFESTTGRVSAGTTQSAAELKATALARAKAFRDRYIKEAEGATDGRRSSVDASTDALRHLRRISTQLTELLKQEQEQDGSDCTPGCVAALESLRALLAPADNKDKYEGTFKDGKPDEGDRSSGPDGCADAPTDVDLPKAVSTFEFVSSDVISALLKYLTAETREECRVHRARVFAQVVLDTENPKVASAAVSPFVSVVRMLQAALASQEKFPVVVNETSGSGSGGLKTLTQPFKLRLQRAPDERRVKDYGENVVLIEPLATLNAVEDFLWPKVMMESAGGGEDARSLSTTTSGNAGAKAEEEKEKEKAKEREREMEKEGKEKEKEKDKEKEKEPERERGRESRRETRSMTRSKSSERKGHGQSLEAHLAGEGMDEGEGVEGEGGGVGEEMAFEEYEEEEGEEVEEGDEDDLFSHAASRTLSSDNVHDVLFPSADTDSQAASSASSSFSKARPSSPPTNINPSQFFSSATTTTATTTTSTPVPSAAASATAPTTATTTTTAVSATGPNTSTTTTASAAAAAAATSTSSSSGSSQTQGAQGQHHLSFFLDGRIVPHTMTIFQAIQRYGRRLDLEMLAEDDRSAANHIWGNIYVITYRYGYRPEDLDNPAASSAAPQPSPSARSSTAAQISSVAAEPPVSCAVRTDAQALDAWLSQPLALTATLGVDPADPCLNSLLLLHALYGISSHPAALGDKYLTQARDWSALSGPAMAHLAPAQEFVSSKLTAKLNRQLQDPLTLCSGGLPEWCPHLISACPFLFSFEARRSYLYSTSFGLSRALHRLQRTQEGHHTERGNDFRVGRIQRQKVRILRTRMLESAMKVMELYASSRTMLEVEYFSEVGTGLGPTLEFYTLVSHELQRRDLALWLEPETPTTTSMADLPEEMHDNRRISVSESKPNSIYVRAPNGLFPAPLPSPAVQGEDSPAVQSVLSHFTFMGRFVAKAIQDSRLLDLPLSPPFLKLVLGQALTLNDARFIDPQLFAVLSSLRNLVVQKKDIERRTDLTESQRTVAIDAICLDGAPVQSLCLDFTVPGRPEVPLKPKGDTETVTIWNVEEYVELVTEKVLSSGVRRQVEAFRSGFDQVFPVANLRPFSPAELDVMICGYGERWDVQMLVENTRCDHGYSHNSRAVRFLLEILSELRPEEQRHFLRFVTGSPRLPVGGLANLNPKLTIVRRAPDTSCSPDDYLPTVMTCANYLKLPEYSSKAVMHRKLLLATAEGQGSFHLS